MSFDISQVLSSNMPLAFEESSDKSDQSQININAQQAITTVINEYAEQLFNDVEFMSEKGLKLLYAFQGCKVVDQEFKERTTELNEQIQVLAHLCHSRNLKAFNEKRSLNSEEESEIAQAFKYLAETHSGDEELHRKLKVLSEATPVVIKVSEAYVRHILPFDEYLKGLTNELDCDENAIDSLWSYRNICFPQSSCNRKGFKAIEETKDLPDFSQLNYQECLTAFSNYILHLALVAKNENREMQPEEVEAVKTAIKAIRCKMGILRMAKKHFNQLEKSKKVYQNTIEELGNLPLDQEAKTKEMLEKINNLKNELVRYNYWCELGKEFKDTEKSLNRRRNTRNRAIKKANNELVKYTEECSKKFTNLQHNKVKQEKLIEKGESSWKAFVAEKFDQPSLAQHDVEVTEAMYFRIGLLMENPEIVAQGAMLFIDHLKNKVEKLPQEEESGWFGWWS